MMSTSKFSRSVARGLVPRAYAQRRPDPVCAPARVEARREAAPDRLGAKGAAR
jgi:hypothetical protein